MPDTRDLTLELYKIYLATAEKVSDRRAAANTWMLSVNSAIVALYGYLTGSAASVEGLGKDAWLSTIPAAGIIVCFAWAALLSSYSKLNGAKFQVLHDMEKTLPIAPFKREEEAYRATSRRALSGVERLIPFAFSILYGVVLLASLMQGIL